MNAAAILALLGDLYSQVMQLQQENAALREQIGTPPTSPPEPGISAASPADL